MTDIALPERWSELSTANKKKKACSEQVESIKTSCAAEHGKAHVAECSECYAKVIDAMHSRFRDPDEREWFTQRGAFRQELEDLFGLAKDRKVSLQHIESRIDAEREAWYRWTLRRYPDFLAVADNGAKQQELRDMLDSPDKSRDELITNMWEGCGKPDKWSTLVDNFVGQVANLQGDQAGLRNLYKQHFFTDTNSSQVLDHAQPSLEEFEAGALTLEQVADKIVKAMQKARSSQPQREAHQRRLDELRRAKMTFEQNRAQAKSQRNQPSSIRPELYELQRCSVCQGQVDSKSVFSCPQCQVAFQRKQADRLAVYCSEVCALKGQVKHVETHHRCTARERCVQQLAGQDVNMEDKPAEAVSCKTCLNDGVLTSYCCGRCAQANISSHTSVAHSDKTSDGDGYGGTKQAKSNADAAGQVAPLAGTVKSLLEKENPELRFSAVA